MNTVLSSLKELGVLTLALTLALVANFAYGQWADPTGAPPSNNTPAPVNVSSNAQTKFGMLTAPVFRAADKMQSDQYCDYAGTNCFSPASVGSGSGSGISNCSLQTTFPSACLYGSGDMSNSVMCPSGYTAIGPAYRTTNCTSNNSTYVRPCARIQCS